MMAIKRSLKTQFLIVSYSYSGNTHRIARGIQEITGGDRYEIYPWQPYPMAFPELLNQVKKEMEHGCYPSLLSGSPSSASYQIVFAGSPNWCGKLAPPLASWLNKNDLSGKIILPFYSHCGGVPADFREEITKLCPRADVREPLQVIGDGGEELKELIGKWLQENGITKDNMLEKKIGGSKYAYQR